jgi:hypothetical protein
MFGLALGLGVAGFGGTFAITHFVDVADGDAAFVSSAGVWMTFITLALGAMIGEEDFFEDQEVWIPITLAGGDAGVVAASLLTGKVDISAGRMNLITLGGILGVMLGTTLTGLGLSIFFTRGYDAPDTAGTGVAALELTEEGWTFNAPPLRFWPTRTSSGESGLAFDLSLVGGRF